MTEEFVIKSSSLLSLNPASPKAGTTFEVTTTINNVLTKLKFDWNGRGGFYTVRLIRDGHHNRNYTLFVYPEEPVTVPGFSESADKPDLFIVITSIIGDVDDTLDRNTLGSTYQVFIGEGRVDNLRVRL